MTGMLDDISSRQHELLHSKGTDGHVLLQENSRLPRMSHHHVLPSVDRPVQNVCPLQAMRWFQMRGAVIHTLHFQEATPFCNDKTPYHFSCTQGACMLILPQLPNLQHLKISSGHGFMIPERNLEVMELLPRLKSLELRVFSDGSWNVDTLTPLMHLRSLTFLNLEIMSMNEPLWISTALTYLSHLVDLRLTCADDKISEESHNQLMEVVSKLTSLRTLKLASMVEAMPAQLGALVQLTAFILCGLYIDGPQFAIPSSFSLCSNLQLLELENFPDASDGAWREVCRSLLLLPRLSDLGVCCVGLSEVQPCSWSLPSGLTALGLGECGVGSIPDALRFLSRLQMLNVIDIDYARDHKVELTSLPRGPYLHHLQMLDLNAPKLGAGPEALADAVNLRYIRVARWNANPLWTHRVLEGLLPQGCLIDFC